MATKRDLILTTTASEADSSSFPSITGIAIDATEPEGTSTRYAFKTGETWQHYDTSNHAWADVATQELTAASVMTEGNTKAEINALPETAFTSWTGHNVNVAIARQTTNNNQPVINGIAVNGQAGAQITTKTVNSNTVVLNNENAVEVLDIGVDASATNGGSVVVMASIQGQDNSWSGYQDYHNYVTSPATVAKAIKFKTVLNAPTVGSSTATINSITVKHRTDNVAVFSEGTGVCLTQTHNYVNNITRAHLMVKHPIVPDTEITAEIALRQPPAEVKGEVLGDGTGEQQSVTLAHTEDLASHGFVLYFDGVQQNASTFSFSPNDGQVTFTAPAGASVTADYIYNWTKETFVSMTHDTEYPDKDDNTLVDDQFDYIATRDTDPTGTVCTVRVSLVQHTGNVANEVLGTATGAQQSFKLAHHAKAETIVVQPSGATWRFKDNTDVLQVTAQEGETISVSYGWAARPNYIESLACIFNE